MFKIPRDTQGRHRRCVSLLYTGSLEGKKVNLEKQLPSWGEDQRALLPGAISLPSERTGATVMGRACRMLVVPLSNSWCFQIRYTLKHGFSIVLVIKDLGFSNGYKLQRPKNPPGFHFIKEQYWVWSNKCYQGSVLMHFKNKVIDNNSSIPLTEIQGRSKTASHFESTAPITQWALEKKPSALHKGLLWGDTQITLAVLWRLQCSRRVNSLGSLLLFLTKQQVRKTPDFHCSKTEEPTHPRTICFIWI